MSDTQAAEAAKPKKKKEKVSMTREEFRQRVLELEKDEFDFYDVEIEFITPACGGTPMSKDLLGKAIEARIKKGKLGKVEAERIMEEMQEFYDGDSVQYEEDEKKKSWNMFKSDEQGIFIESRCIKSMLKQAMVSCRMSQSAGMKGARHTMQEVCSVRPLRVRMYRGGEQLKEADEWIERPVSAMTREGKIQAIKRTDSVGPGTRVRFEIWLPKLPNHAGPRIEENDLFKLLVYAQKAGLMSDRSQEFGQFRLLWLEKIDETKWPD